MYGVAKGVSRNERLTYYEFDNSSTGRVIKSFDDPNTFDVDIDAIKNQYKSDNNSVDFYVVKDMTIPSGSAFTHDSKIVMLAGDRLYFVSDTATSLDVIVSYVENIST